MFADSKLQRFGDFEICEMSTQSTSGCHVVVNLGRGTRNARCATDSKRATSHMLGLSDRNLPMDQIFPDGAYRRTLFKSEDKRHNLGAN